MLCGKSRVGIQDRPSITQRCKQFATASISTQVVVLPWCNVAVMGKVLQTRYDGRYTLRRNTTGIMKGLIFDETLFDCLRMANFNTDTISKMCEIACCGE